MSSFVPGIRATIALVAVLALFPALPGRLHAESAAPRAAGSAAAAPHRGRLDLSGLARGGTAALDGEWEFHWGAFVSPSLLSSGGAPARDWRPPSRRMGIL